MPTSTKTIISWSGIIVLKKKCKHTAGLLGVRKNDWRVGVFSHSAEMSFFETCFLEYGRFPFKCLGSRKSYCLTLLPQLPTGRQDGDQDPSDRNVKGGDFLWEVSQSQWLFSNWFTASAVKPILPPRNKFQVILPYLNNCFYTPIRASIIYIMS